MTDKPQTAPEPLTDLYVSCQLIIGAARGIPRREVTQDQVALFWQSVWNLYNG